MAKIEERFTLKLYKADQSIRHYLQKEFNEQNKHMMSVLVGDKAKAIQAELVQNLEIAAGNSLRGFEKKVNEVTDQTLREMSEKHLLMPRLMEVVRADMHTHMATQQWINAVFGTMLVILAFTQFVLRK